jgi:hypothetical protein
MTLVPAAIRELTSSSFSGTADDEYPFLKQALLTTHNWLTGTRAAILHIHFVVGGVPTGRTSIGMYRGTPPGPGHIEIRAAMT